MANASATLRLHGTDCPTLYADIGASEKRVTLPFFGNPNWKEYLGKKVTVVFGPGDEIEQVVLGKEHISAATREAGEKLLRNSRIGWPIQFLAIEAGSWMLVTENASYHSSVFTSGDRDTLYYLRDGKEPLAEVKGKIPEGESFRELVLFHTHIGKGEPLNRHDVKAIEEEAKKAFALYPSLEVVTLYAVPLKNKGELYFRYRVFRKP